MKEKRMNERYKNDNLEVRGKNAPKSVCAQRVPRAPFLRKRAQFLQIKLQGDIIVHYYCAYLCTALL